MTNALRESTMRQEQAKDVKPDTKYHPEGNKVGQERKEVAQQRVGLSREALVENLQLQWDHD